MNIAVYLGSSIRCKEEYRALAYEVGRKLALEGHTIIYGGADVGMMKDLADGAQSADGKVIGVFPEHFKGTGEVKEKGMRVIREGLAQMIIVKDFAERKNTMETLSDCSLTLPGSFGTLDELFTFVCDNTIGYHSKKAYLLNYKGFYSPVKELLKNTLDAGLLKPETVDVVNFCDTIDDFLSKILF